MTQGLEALFGTVKRHAETLFGASVFNPSARERALIAALLALGALYGTIAAFDLAQRQRDRAVETIAEAAVLANSERASRSDAAFLVERQVARVRQHAFAAETVSIAQVGAQAYLEAAMREAGIENARVTLAPDIIGDGDIKLLAITLEGSFAWPSFLKLADTLAHSGQNFAIESFAVIGSGNPSFELKVQTVLMVAQA